MIEWIFYKFNYSILSRVKTNEIKAYNGYVQIFITYNKKYNLMAVRFNTIITKGIKVYKKRAFQKAKLNTNEKNAKFL
jgi:16S rRNA G527 N7-methylase RsmG